HISTDLEPWHSHRAREYSVFRARRRRIRLLIQGQARSTARRDLRCPERREVQGLWQLGPLLRLDEVRAAARFVRRRLLARFLSFSRHPELEQPQPEQHARQGLVESEGSEREPGSARAEL